MIEGSVKGPWAVDNNAVGWHIVNRDSGRRKYVGRARPVRRSAGVNYFDRALQWADERNAALVQSNNVTNDVTATRLA